MDSQFGLVMITEYSEESYLLLRRKMCWDVSDILYISINLRSEQNGYIRGVQLFGSFHPCPFTMVLPIIEVVKSHVGRCTCMCARAVYYNTKTNM